MLIKTKRFLRVTRMPALLPTRKLTGTRFIDDEAVAKMGGTRSWCFGQMWATRPKFTLDITRTMHNHMVVDNLGTTFAALSDPTRRAMIERLSHGPASVHGLTEPFALSQQMISKHIAYLVRARIVIKTKRGRESVCRLRPEAIKTVSDWAISYRRFWEESFDKLEVVVNQMKKEGGQR